MTETTTDNVRGWGGCMFVVGAILCMTPLVAPGAILAIIGAGMWLSAPANAGRTQRMVDEAEEGGGCMAGLGAAIFVVAAVLGAGVVALVAALALLGGS